VFVAFYSRILSCFYRRHDIFAVRPSAATNAAKMSDGTPHECEKSVCRYFETRSSLMKALVSAFALLTFVAGTLLPIESDAQAAGTAESAAPDAATSMAPSTTTPTKKKKSSKSHHAKRKSKKSSTAQTSSYRQKHARRHGVG
jgi:hypothetical protein